MNAHSPVLKDRLPRFLSYPLTTSEILSHLSVEVAGYPLQFGFSDSRSVHCPTDLIPVVTFRFLYADIEYPKGILSDISRVLGYSLPRWDLTVHSIFKTQRPLIRSLLFASGCEKLQTWHEAMRSPNWYQQNHCFRVLFDPERGMLSYASNDRAGL